MYLAPVSDLACVFLVISPLHSVCEVFFLVLYISLFFCDIYVLIFIFKDANVDDLRVFWHPSSVFVIACCYHYFVSLGKIKYVYMYVYACCVVPVSYTKLTSLGVFNSFS
jgi:hypothetical protein